MGQSTSNDSPQSNDKTRLYRKKPIAVEAVQWFPDPDFGEFTEKGYYCRRVAEDIHGVEYLITEVGLRTKEGFMRIKPGDWIITGVEGERYACDAGIFAKTYEPATSSSAVAELTQGERRFAYDLAGKYFNAAGRYGGSEAHELCRLAIVNAMEQMKSAPLSASTALPDDVRRVLLDARCEFQRLNGGAPVSRGHVDALIERLSAAIGVHGSKT